MVAWKLSRKTEWQTYSEKIDKLTPLCEALAEPIWMRISQMEQAAVRALEADACLWEKVKTSDARLLEAEQVCQAEIDKLTEFEQCVVIAVINCVIPSIETPVLSTYLYSKVLQSAGSSLRAISPPAVDLTCGTDLEVGFTQHLDALKCKLAKTESYYESLTDPVKERLLTLEEAVSKRWCQTVATEPQISAQDAAALLEHICREEMDRLTKFECFLLGTAISIGIVKDASMERKLLKHLYYSAAHGASFLQLVAIFRIDHWFENDDIEEPDVNEEPDETRTMWNKERRSLTDSVVQAASDGNVEHIRALVSKGANVNAMNDEGETALIAAVSSGDIECVKFLISEQVNIDATSKSGETAIIRALSRFDFECHSYLSEEINLLNELCPKLPCRCTSSGGGERRL